MPLRQAINSLKALHEAMPEELKDKLMHRCALCRLCNVYSNENLKCRNPNASLADYSTTGQQLFRSVYGDKAGSVQDMLDSAYPDMGIHLPSLSRHSQDSGVCFQGGSRKRLAMG